MTDLELEEQRMLQAARRELSPDAHAIERVRVATEHALFASAAAGIAADAGHGAVDAGPMQVLWHAPGAVTRLIAAVVLSTSAGVVGYALGAESGRPDRAPTTTELRSVTPVVVAAPLGVAALPERSVAAPVAPVAPVAPTEPAAEAVLAARVEAPAPGSAVAAKDAGARGELPSRSARPASASAALQLEIAAVKRVESELRAGNPSKALELLEELQRSVPRGQLREERSAADTIARCALGIGDALALERAFVAAFPGSVYEARVVKRCDEAAR